MTEHEYSMSGCENYLSEFLFADGTTVVGVITTFFMDKPRSYQLVKSRNMQAFSKYTHQNDLENMRALCQEIDLATLVTARRLE